MAVDLDRLSERADELWESSILPSLCKFIEIEALSPGFEPNWAEKGELDATIDLFTAWLDEQNIENGLRLRIVLRVEGEISDSKSSSRFQIESLSPRRQDP